MGSAEMTGVGQQTTFTQTRQRNEVSRVGFGVVQRNKPSIVELGTWDAID